MKMKLRLPARRPKKMFAVLPTLLTLGNAVCGFGAISFASGWTRVDSPSTTEPGSAALLAAGALLFLAMLFDGLDGAAARWTKQTSEFGSQLDSLCDAISFGAAPAFLMLELSRPVGYHPRVLWAIAALYMVCAVLRLARFNAEHDVPHEPGEFSGLPSPAAAAVVASFPIMLFGPQFVTGYEPDPTAIEVDGWLTRALPLITLGVACLMVSRVRYAHAFRNLIGRRRGRKGVLKVVFAAAVAVAVPRVTIPLIACWYAFTPPAMALWSRHLRPMLFGKPADPPTGAEPPTDPAGGDPKVS